MWVTVLASQPSVSIATDTTQRMCSPSRPRLPTVFMTSRRMSSSVMSSALRPGKRATYSRLNCSISARGGLAERRVERVAAVELGRVDQEGVRAVAEAAVLLVAEERQVARDDDLRRRRAAPSPSRRSSRRRACDVAVFEQTTMNTGGVPMPASAQARVARARSRRRGERRAPSSSLGMTGRPSIGVSLMPLRGSASRTRSQRSRYIGPSPVIESSLTGTRGILTMPDSIASISPKSLTTHGKSVPSA